MDHRTVCLISLIKSSDILHFEKKKKISQDIAIEVFIGSFFLSNNKTNNFENHQLQIVNVQVFWSGIRSLRWGYDITPLASVEVTDYGAWDARPADIIEDPSFHACYTMVGSVKAFKNFCL